MESRRYYFNEENGTFDYFDSALTKFSTYIKRDVTYVLFSETYVGNWDILAKKVYGDEKLWWIILLANEISDPWDKSLVGTNLKIPDKKDFYDFYRDNFNKNIIST